MPDPKVPSIFANQIFTQLHQHPDAKWITINDKFITYAQVIESLARLKETLNAAHLTDLNRKIVGIAMNASYEFIIVDLLCLREQAITLPISLGCNDDQIRTLLSDVDIVLVRNDRDAVRISSILPNKPLVNAKTRTVLKKYQWNGNTKNLPAQIAKIIYTSSTASEPKGVLIKSSSLMILMDSLLKIFPQQALSYLSFCSMTLLVEQIFAIYCTLLTKGILIILPESIHEVDINFMPSKIFFNLIRDYQPTFAYLTAQLIYDLNQMEHWNDFPKDTYYIYGGAPINYRIMEELTQKGFKIYEGYGLSETTSVVSINGFDNCRSGTAGKILPHIDYKIYDGELLLRGPSICAGYFAPNQSASEIDKEGYLHTGDLASVDYDRYLTIQGRKEHILTLLNDHNISPEWVESKLKKYGNVENCIVLGKGQEFLTAILLGSKEKNMDLLMQKVNADLPHYAQIQYLIIIVDKEKFKNKYFTVTNHPKRALIHQDYIRVEPSQWHSVK